LKKLFIYLVVAKLLHFDAPWYGEMIEIKRKLTKDVDLPVSCVTSTTS
jgi:hypothetical protein